MGRQGLYPRYVRKWEGFLRPFSRRLRRRAVVPQRFPCMKQVYDYRGSGVLVPLGRRPTRRARSDWARSTRCLVGDWVSTSPMRQAWDRHNHRVAGRFDVVLWSHGALGDKRPACNPKSATQIHRPDAMMDQFRA